VAFCENAFYRFQDGKIRDVRSVIDEPAIEAQLISPMEVSPLSDR
jgi:predicted ester cyclase